VDACGSVPLMILCWRPCRWAERLVLGDPPLDPHWRRNLEALHDGRRLLVLGARPPARVLPARCPLGLHAACILPAGPADMSRGHVHLAKRSRYPYQWQACDMP
jgi:hypothetical protein